MSTAFGGIPTDGESSNPIGGDGLERLENGSGGSEGNAGRTSGVFGGLESFDPSNYTERIARTEPTAGNSGSEPRRTKSGKIDRRTRAGRGNAPETSHVVTSAKELPKVSLEKAIIGLHDMAAALFGVEELVMSEPEAREYSSAILDLSKYYLPDLDPKKVAMANLLTCMGGIYTSRIMAYRNRMAFERRQKIRLMPNQSAPAPAPTAAPVDNIGVGLNPPIEGGGEW